MSVQQAFEIFITYIDKEGPLLKIWAQLDRNSATLVERVIIQLKDQFDRGIGTPEAASLRLGQLCCAKYSDSSYYRAQVTDLTSITASLVGVKFVDYGNNENVAVNCIRVLNGTIYEHLASLPHQATEFYLAGVVPNSGEWDQSTLAFIRQTLCYEEVKCVVVAQVNDKRLIRLFYENQEFGQELMKKNLANNISLAGQESLVQGLFGTVSSTQWQMFNPTVPPPGPPPGLVNVNPLVPPPGIPNIGTMKLGMRMNTNLSSSGGIHSTSQTETAKVFTSPVLEPHSEHKVYVSFVEDGPLSFAVQLEAAEQILSSVMTEINSLPPASLRDPPMPGSVCLARYTGDRKLCRAVIMSVKNESCKVYYVDFGNTESLPYTEIFELPQKYINPKVLALRFSLSGIKDLNITEELKMIFQALVADKLLILKVMPREGPPLKQYGELYDVASCKSIRDVMVEKAQAKASSRMSTKLLSYPKLQVAVDTQDDVIVSYVDGISCFYVQFEVNVDKLNSLMEKLGMYCDNLDAQLDVKKVTMNMPCCARYSEDNLWYRAQIISPIHDNTVKIVFVDYGNEEYSNLSNLKPIDQTLVKSLPAQGIKCSLNGFEESEANDDIAKMFEEMTSDKSLNVSFVKEISEGTFVVDLYSKNEVPAIYINKELKNAVRSVKPEKIKPTFKIPTAAREDSADWQETETAAAQATTQEPRYNHASRHSNFSGEKADVPQKGNRRGQAYNKGSWKIKQSQQRNSNRRAWYQEHSTDSSRSRRFDSSESSESWRQDDRSDSIQRQKSSEDNNWRSRDERRGKWGSEGDRKGKWDGDGERRNKWDNEGGERRNKWDNEGGERRNKWDNDGGERRNKWDNDGERRNKWDSEGGERRNKWDNDGGERRNKWDNDGGERRNKWDNDGGERRNKWDGENDKWGKRDSGTDRWKSRDNSGNGTWNKQDEDGDGGWKKDRNRFDGDKKPFNRDRGGMENRERRFEKPWKRNDGTDSFDASENKSRQGGWNNQSRARENSQTKSWQSSSTTTAEGDDWDTNSASTAPSGPKFQELQVNTGSTKEVDVVYIYSPELFYVQLKDSASELSTLMEEIASISTSGAPLTSASKEQLCIAQFSEDAQFYRAVVKEITGNTAHVAFVDYGNEDDVELENMREVTSQFCALPMQAVKCTLHGIESKGEEWTDEEIAQLTSFTEEKKLQAEFVRYVPGLYHVILKDIESSEVINVKFGMDPSKSVEVVQPFTPVPQLSVDAFTEMLFTVGQSEEVVVSWFINPENFYIQLLSFSTEFQTMMSEIQRVYQKRMNQNVPCKIGLPVITRFPLDRVLYRAEIKSVKDREVVVSFVDYGNSSIVSKNELWHVDPVFVTLPKQAVLCSLEGVNPATDAWPKAGSSKVDKHFESSNYKCMFGQKEEDKYRVQLFLKDSSVAESLINDGLAIQDSTAIHLDDAEDDHEEVNLDLYTGQFVPVHVTYVEGLSKFFVHLNVDRANLVQGLVDHHCETVEKVAIPAEKLTPESLCISTVDDTQWYRGEVGNCTGTTGVYVKFIDYGDGDEVPCDKVLEIPANIAAYPKQAVECTLLGAEEVTSLELDEQFKGETEDKDVILMVEGVSSEKLTVVLFIGEKNFNQEAGLLKDDYKIEKPTVLPMPVRQKAKVWVSHMESPEVVWLQYATSIDTLSELLEQLFNHYENSELACLTAPSINQACAAKSLADGQWYRASVLEVTEEGVNVKFIDYGNSENVPLEHLKELDESFTSKPEMAKCVSLAVVLRSGEEWPEDIDAQLGELLNDKEFTAYFYYIDGKFVAELIEADERVSNKLVALGLANKIDLPELPEPISEPIAVAVQEETDKQLVFVSHVESPGNFWIQYSKDSAHLEKLQDELQSADFEDISGPLDETSIYAAQYSVDEQWYRASISQEEDGFVATFVDYGNSDVVDKESIKLLPSKFIDVAPYAKQCTLNAAPVCELWSVEAVTKFEEMVTASDNPLEVKIIQSCDKGPNVVDIFMQCVSVTNTLASDGFCVCNQDPQENVIVQQEIDKKTDEEQGDTKVTVSFVISPAKFWIQFEQEHPVLDDVMDKLTVAESFEQLPPEEGAICAALYPDDESWYRGKVISVVDAEVEIYFIDYGNTSLVSRENVKKLPNDLLVIPPLAKLASLPDLDPSANWPEDIVQKFQEKVGEGDKILNANVLSSEVVLIVSLFDNNQKIEDEFSMYKLQTKESPKTESDKMEVEEEEMVREEPHIPEEQAEDKAENESEEILEEALVEAADAVETVDTAKEVLEGDFIEEVLDGDFVDLPTAYEGDFVEEVFEGDSVDLPTASEGDFIEEVFEGDSVDLPTASEGDFVDLPTASEEEPTTSSVDAAAETESDFDQIKEEAAEKTDAPALVKSEKMEFFQDISSQPSMRVLVACVVSPSTFWIQPEDEKWQLSELREKLELAESFDTEEPKEGEIYAALSADNVWYRGQVTSVTGKDVAVQFIDYGNSAHVTSDCLRMLPNELKVIHPLARQCKMVTDRTEWPEVVINKFKELTGYGDKILTAHVLDFGDPLTVDLMAGDHSIMEQITSICGEYESNETEKAEGSESSVNGGPKAVEEMDKSEVVKIVEEIEAGQEIFYDSFDEEDMDESQTNVELKIPETGIEEAVPDNDTKDVTNEQTDQLKVISGDEDNLTDDSKTTFDAEEVSEAESMEMQGDTCLPTYMTLPFIDTDANIPPIAVPKGVEMDVVLLNVSTEKLSLRLAEQVPTCNKMTVAINAFYGAPANHILLPADEVVVGKLCAIEVTESKQWHRCVVCTGIVNGSAQVFLLDVGLFQKVECGHLKLLDKSFLRFPPLAIYCKVTHKLSTQLKHALEILSMSATLDLCTVKFMDEAVELKLAGNAYEQKSIQLSVPNWTELCEQANEENGDIPHSKKQVRIDDECSRSSTPYEETLIAQSDNLDDGSYNTASSGSRPSTPKIPHSEKILPGCISGVLDNKDCDDAGQSSAIEQSESDHTDEESTLSNTQPAVVVKSAEDKIVPGAISKGEGGDEYSDSM